MLCSGIPVFSVMFQSFKEKKGIMGSADGKYGVLDVVLTASSSC